MLSLDIIILIIIVIKLIFESNLTVTNKVTDKWIKEKVNENLYGSRHDTTGGDPFKFDANVRDGW
jgi:hypothetical protein